MPKGRFKGTWIKTQCKRGHDLSKHRRREKGGRTYCFLCKKLKTTKYQKTPKGKASFARAGRRWMLKHRYGVTPEFVAGKPCGICGTKTFGMRGPAVDHDHLTGKVRGILCGSCNIALGLMGDQLTPVITFASNAVAYLTKAELL